jgi:transcriptional regulator with XRE-family HTH domain
VRRIVLALRKAREARGITQVELAAAVKVRQATISDLERGETRRIDLDLLTRIAKALEVEPSALFEWEPARRK